MKTPAPPATKYNTPAANCSALKNVVNSMGSQFSMAPPPKKIHRSAAADISRSDSRTFLKWENKKDDKKFFKDWNFGFSHVIFNYL